MNPGAIDSHRSEFAVRHDGDEVEDEANDGSDEEEPDEPQ